MPTDTYPVTHIRRPSTHPRLSHPILGYRGHTQRAQNTGLWHGHSLQLRTAQELPFREGTTRQYHFGPCITRPAAPLQSSIFTREIPPGAALAGAIRRLPMALIPHAHIFR